MNVTLAYIHTYVYVCLALHQTPTCLGIECPRDMMESKGKFVSREIRR